MRVEDAPRSKLVTRVGQLFLLGSTALMGITASQLLVVFSPAAPEPARPMHYPGVSQAAVFLAALLLLYSLTLAVSFALLKRIAWARPALIVILGLGIALNLARLVWTTLGEYQEELPEDGPAKFQLILRVASVLDVLLPIALITAFAWLIVKLNSAAVRSEFEPGGRRA